MKKFVVPLAFVFVLLLALLVGLGGADSHPVHATNAANAISADFVPPIYPTTGSTGTIRQMSDCQGGSGSEFFNIHADYAQSWVCFANAGAIKVDIYGVNEICSGNNVGEIITTDDEGPQVLYVPQKYQCKSFPDHQYHHIATIGIYIERN